MHQHGTKSLPPSIHLVSWAFLPNWMLYENLTYVPHVAHGYCVKLQHIRNDIRQIIQLTSGGLLMLASILLPLSLVLLHLHVHACMCTCMSIPHYDEEQLNEDTYRMRCFYLLNEQGKPPDCILRMRQQILISFPISPKRPIA